MKLELKHLASYLPYNLKAVNFNTKNYGLNFLIKDIDASNITTLIDFSPSFKPILFPLSSLTKDDIKNFYQFNNYDLKSIDLKEWVEDLIFLINEKEPFQLSQFEYLFSKKFDVFGLIDAGLAEQVTEDFNPYK